MITYYADRHMICDSVVQKLKQKLAWQIAEVLLTDGSCSAFNLLFLFRSVLPIPFWVQNAILSLLHTLVLPYFVTTALGVQYDIFKNAVIGLMIYSNTSEADNPVPFVTNPVFPIAVNVLGTVTITFYVRYLLAVQIPAMLREEGVQIKE